MSDNMPIKELKMTKERIIEALGDIEGQLSNGYIDFSLFDKTELEIIEQAIKEFRLNHKI